MYIYDSGKSGSGGGLHGIYGIGLDPSLRVPDSTMPPYSWICALDVHFSGRGKATPGVTRRTGFLISPRHVLTVALGLTHTDGAPDTLRKIVVTPGLDGAKSSGKARAPFGSVDLKAGDWWIPNQYYQPGGSAWNVALLTLPKLLPKIPGERFGFWFLKPATPATLAGGTVSTSGYPSGECNRDPRMAERSVRVEAGWASTQLRATGTVLPTREPLPSEGKFLYDGATCSDMMGSPLWLETDRRSVVAMHLFSDFPDYSTRDAQRVSVGFALRPEILDLLRQRLSLDQVRATF